MSTTNYRTMRANTNPVIQLMSDGWDQADPWGSGMMALGDVCDVLTAAGELDRVDPGAGFRPAWSATGDNLDALLDEGGSYMAVTLAEAVQEGEVTVDDLARASRVLSLYLDVVKAAGRDY